MVHFSQNGMEILWNQKNKIANKGIYRDLPKLKKHDSGRLPKEIKFHTYVCKKTGDNPYRVKPAARWQTGLSATEWRQTGLRARTKKPQDPQKFRMRTSHLRSPQKQQERYLKWTHKREWKKVHRIQKRINRRECVTKKETDGLAGHPLSRVPAQEPPRALATDEQWAQIIKEQVREVLFSAF